MVLYRFPLVVLIGILAGCSTLPGPVDHPQPRWPQVRLVVFTDPHVLAPSLVTSEAAGDRLDRDSIQIYRESPEVLQTLVSRCLAERPSAVLITGDLTKDGERVSHQFVADTLRPLVAAGIPVLVIPGNHDVANPAAAVETDAGPRTTATVTPAEFAEIYREFGYDRALSRDPASLSYLAEPVPGLRVLALDSIRYEENAGRTRPVTGGRIRSDSWAWIDKVLDQAAHDGTAVTAMMHHGLVEKFEGQGFLFADYLVADRKSVAARLAARGVQVVFTGHFHTLSIAETLAEGRPILDIEGGTVSAYPLGFRRVDTAGGRLKVTTDHVLELPSWSDRPGEFAAKAKTLSSKNVGTRVSSILRRWGVPRSDADLLAQTFGGAFAAVGAGDPVRPEGWVWPPQGLGPAGSIAVSFLGNIPEGLWHPAPPGDLAVDLALPLPPASATR